MQICSFFSFFITNNELCMASCPLQTKWDFFPQWIRERCTAYSGQEMMVGNQRAALADSPPSPPLKRLSVEILPGWCLRWVRTKLVRLRMPAYLERGPPGSGWTACCCRSSWSRLGWSSGWPAGTSPAPGCWRSLTTRPELQTQRRLFSLKWEHQEESQTQGVVTTQTYCRLFCHLYYWIIKGKSPGKEKLPIQKENTVPV